MKTLQDAVAAYQAEQAKRLKEEADIQAEKKKICEDLVREAFAEIEMVPDAVNGLDAVFFMDGKPYEFHVYRNYHANYFYRYLEECIFCSERAETDSMLLDLENIGMAISSPTPAHHECSNPRPAEVTPGSAEERLVEAIKELIQEYVTT